MSRRGLRFVTQNQHVAQDLGYAEQANHRWNEVHARDQLINPHRKTGDAEIIKLLVQHGEGVSFLVKEAVAGEIQEKKLVAVPLKDNSIFLDVSIAYLKNQPLSPSAQAFLNSLENLGTKKMRFQGMGALMTKMLAEEKQ